MADPAPTATDLDRAFNDWQADNAEFLHNGPFVPLSKRWALFRGGWDAAVRVLTERADQLRADRDWFVRRLGEQHAEMVKHRARASAAEAALAEQTELIRQIVMDYADHCCDHLDNCDCSIARAHRTVAALDTKETNHHE